MRQSAVPKLEKQVNTENNLGEASKGTNTWGVKTCTVTYELLEA
jgi:hypothetical protein